MSEDLRHRTDDTAQLIASLKKGYLEATAALAEERERAEAAESALKEVLQKSRNYQILYADEVKARMTAVRRLARVRAVAEEWAELAERGDPCAERMDLAVADCGRAVLAALDDQEAASLPPEEETHARH